MAFSRIVLGWGLLSLLFVVWDVVAQRAASSSSPAPASTRFTATLIESLLLTLFAGLWFGTLGSGGVWLLFLLVGLLMEVPHRIRRRASEPISWKSVFAGLLRIGLAGLVLSLVLGGRIV